MAADVTGTIRFTLKGVRVLLIEDEYFIADEVRRVIEEAGAIVVGPANSMTAAKGLIDQGAFDCAVLDLNLNGENAIPLADRLVAENRDFVIATGYGSPSIPDRLKHVPRIEKPFEPAALLKLVSQLSCAKVG